MNVQFIHANNVRNIVKHWDGVAMSTFYTVEETCGGLNTASYPGSCGDKVAEMRRGTEFGVPGKWDMSCNCCDKNPNRR